MEAPRSILFERELQAKPPEVAQGVLRGYPLAPKVIASLEEEDRPQGHCSSVPAQFPVKCEVDSVFVPTDNGSRRLQPTVDVVAYAKHGRSRENRG